MIVSCDTNVLLYAADGRDPQKQAMAAQTLRAFPDAVLLWQVAVEFVASSRKLAASGMTIVDAWDLLAHYLGTFHLVVPTPFVLERARSLHIDHQWSFWDALITAACIEAGVTRLYSEDRPGRAPPQPLEIINPFA